jgi:hypothetical protein
MMTRSLVTEKRRAEVGKDPLVCCGWEREGRSLEAGGAGTHLAEMVRDFSRKLVTMCQKTVGIAHVR